MLKTHKFARKPFYVDAVRVSEANMKEVAEWCDGTIKTQGDAGRAEEEVPFIAVKVYRPLNERQSQAFVGDWVLFAGSGFKVYTPKAFDKSFEKVKTLTKAQADEAGIKVPHEPRPKPVPTEPRPKPVPTEREIGTNVGEAIRKAQEAKEAQEAKKAQEAKEIVVGFRRSKKAQEVVETPPVAKTPQEIEADKLITEVLKHPRI